jgi:hypothetical protein
MLSSTFIDEFGYLNLKPEQSNIFFKLMEERAQIAGRAIRDSASPWSASGKRRGGGYYRVGIREQMLAKSAMIKICASS